MQRRANLAILMTLPFLLACDVEEESAADFPADTAAVDTILGTGTGAVPADHPDTTAEAVWAYLQEQSYQDEWEMWPEKERYYEGVEPHGALLSTYLNSIAMDALAGNASELPARSMIVKENFTPDSTLAAITVMYKVPGYDAENQDWWWLKRTAAGEVEASGRVEGCISCHGTASDNDYVLTGTLESGGAEITAAAEAQQGGE